jgi:hypothetical protein
MTLMRWQPLVLLRTVDKLYNKRSCAFHLPKKCPVTHARDEEGASTCINGMAL